MAIRFHNGTSWDSGIPKVHDGTSWTTYPVKVHDGTSWVVVSGVEFTWNVTLNGESIDAHVHWDDGTTVTKETVSLSDGVGSTVLTEILPNSGDTYWIDIEYLSPTTEAAEIDYLELSW